jgi:hypothetical protein
VCASAFDRDGKRADGVNRQRSVQWEGGLDPVRRAFPGPPKCQEISNALSQHLCAHALAQRRLFLREAWCMSIFVKPTDDTLAKPRGSGGSPGSNIVRDSAVNPMASFSELECRVITLACQPSEYCDRTTPEKQSKLWNICCLLIGQHHHRPLANPKLESLRRMVSELRYRPAGPHADSTYEFFASGYNPFQLDALRSMVPPHRQVGIRRAFWFLRARTMVISRP